MNRALASINVGMVLAAVAGCGTGGGSADGTGGGLSGAQRLDGAGSSFVYPMMTKWTSEYEKAKNIRVNYESTGSGNGIKGLTEKSLDFGCTDAPMNEEQLAKVGGPDKVVHIPLVMGAVVPIYNLEEVKQDLKFSGPLLADIYLEKVKRWNDPKIAALNPGVALPDKEILTVHRSDGSGTTFIWTDYLSKIS